MNSVDILFIADYVHCKNVRRSFDKFRCYFDRFRMVHRSTSNVSSWAAAVGDGRKYHYKKAPFNHPNLRLSKDEIEFYNKRTRQCLILLNLLTVFLLMIGFNCCAYSVVMGIAVTAISLIVVK